MLYHVNICQVVNNFKELMGLRHHFSDVPASTTVEQLFKMVTDRMEIETEEKASYKFTMPVATGFQQFHSSSGLKLQLLEFCNQGRSDSHGRVRLRSIPSLPDNQDLNWMLIDLAGKLSIGIPRLAIANNAFILSMHTCYKSPAYCCTDSMKGCKYPINGKYSQKMAGFGEDPVVRVHVL